MTKYIKCISNTYFKLLVFRPPSRRISLRPEKKCGLAAGNIAASRQPGRKKYAA